MATHSSILACEIPWTEKPARLLSIGSQRVRCTLQNQPLLETGAKSRELWARIHLRVPGPAVLLDAQLPPTVLSI